MRITTVAAALAAVLGAVVSPMLAAKGDIPVTSMVSDYDSGVAPRLQLQSDKLGAYTNSKTLASLIQSVGSWSLDSYYANGSTRSIYLDFSQPVPGTGVNGSDPTPLPSAFYKAHVISKCEKYGNSFFTIAPGTTVACPLALHFDSGGATYDLHMNPQNSSWSETDYVNVTCIFPTSGAGPCKQWRITPSGTYTAQDGTVQYRNIANLSIEVTNRGQTTLVKQGDFYFSFLMLVTNP